MNNPDVTSRNASSLPSWVGLLLWLALCAAVGFIGAIASVDAKDFYSVLDKPAWAPPPPVFGPVWTVLYVLMGVAAWLVWRERGWAQASGALTLFVAQLALNALWSWLFFAWEMGGLALADIILMWALILATLLAFARVRKLAGWLLVPYLLWVTFAAALNCSVWLRNPQLM
jgi:tryptophan-rich sensory protein